MHTTIETDLSTANRIPAGRQFEGLARRPNFAGERKIALGP